jgi:hypothetical protein
MACFLMSGRFSSIMTSDTDSYARLHSQGSPAPHARLNSSCQARSGWFLQTQPMPKCASGEIRRPPPVLQLRRFVDVLAAVRRYLPETDHLENAEMRKRGPIPGTRRSRVDEATRARAAQSACPAEPIRKCQARSPPREAGVTHVKQKPRHESRGPSASDDQAPGLITRSRGKGLHADRHRFLALEGHGLDQAHRQR